MKVCSVGSCQISVNLRKGWCVKHYTRWSRYGDPEHENPNYLRGTLLSRFEAKVIKGEGCWGWKASTTASGYAQIKEAGKMLVAHRVSYELYLREIPQGYLVDHRCHTRSCTNPAHLRLVTNKQNMENRGSLAANNTSGYQGVYWRKRTQRWVAQVGHHKKVYCNGYWPPYEIHVAAYKATELRNRLFTHNELDRMVS